MARISTAIMTVLLAGTLTACEDDGIVRADKNAATEETADVTLGDIRSMINEPREVVIPDGPQIDPAAMNINPFKYGLEYNYKEREALDRLLIQARADVHYLSRSLEATRESLGAYSPQILWQDYLSFMDCAVKYDLGARHGLSSASAAQAKAAEFVEHALDPDTGTRPATELTKYREDRAELLANESSREKYAREQLEEEELNKLRTRNYLNYFLLRDVFANSMDAEALKTELDACEALV